MLGLILLRGFEFFQETEEDIVCYEIEWSRISVFKRSGLLDSHYLVLSMRQQ